MKYTTLNPVRHNGTLHGSDEVLELDDKAAAPLLDCGAIAPHQEEQESSGGETESAEKDQEPGNPETESAEKDQEPEKAETKAVAKPAKGKGSKAK